jgi:hypothetical protein
MHARTKIFHRLLGPHPVAALALAMALAPALGCDTDKLGAPCPLDVSEATPTLYHVDQNAVVCPSRLCLLPPAQRTTNTQALCSTTCRTDDDCQGGQSRDLNDRTDRRCLSGFSCKVVIPALPDSQPCQKMCACRDFFDDGQAAPLSCP